MSEDLHDDGEIEVAPDATEDSGRRAGTAGWALGLALLSVLAVAGGLLAGYVYWRQAQASLHALDQGLAQTAREQEALGSRLEALRDELASQRAGLQRQGARLDEEQSDIARREAEMRGALASVQRRLGGAGEQWKVAEAEYLLRIASHRLGLMRDVGTALAALDAADARLAATGDPAWVPVREAIAADQAALRATELPDRAGLSARISGLIEQVDGLSLPGVPRQRPQARQADEPAPREDRSLSTALSDGLAGLRALLVIRRHDRPMTALLSAEQEASIKQGLRLQLQSARLGMLQADPELYRAALDTAGAWLAELFPPDAAAARALRDAVAELRAVDVRPELPDLSRSLAALRQRLDSGAAEASEP
ncbi:MAG: uroporphyrinogen-III C-methyltransferase [Chromatiales bacterium]|jgi:uroporphyrin-3 C-methyltransferase